MSLKTTLAALALLAVTQVAHAATVISLSDFADAKIESFDAAPLGRTNATKPLFANLGITSIRASYNKDRFNTRVNSSRALGINKNGNLRVIDPGTRGLSSSYSLVFANAITQFGFGIHDQRTRLTLKFLNNGKVVDTKRLRSRSRDLVQFYLRAAAFDQVIISARKAKHAFALDNLTVEALTPIPVPAGFPLLLTAIGAFVWVRRKAIL